MKIVVIGHGKIGSKLAQQLVQEGHDIVVIDNDSAALQSVVNNEDLMCVEGNAVDYQVQMEAGIPESDLVIACTDGDELNMLCCLLAKKHGAARTIARVRNPQYYEQLPFIREEMGLSMAINPELEAANMITRVLSFPAANSIEPFAKGRVELIEFILEAGNPLIGETLAQVNQKYGLQVLICAIQRDEKVFIPGGRDVLQDGDRIYLVSSHAHIRSFFRHIDVFRSSVKTVMIVGGGRLAYYLAKQLLERGMRVKIIEQNMDRCRELCEELPKAVIVHGDGSDEEVLGEEGIGNMDAFVAMTGLDEVNVILSLYAKTQHVSKIFTKVTQISFTGLLEHIGVESIFSPKQVTANQILRYVRALDASSGSDGVESLSRLIDGKLEALEFRIQKEAPYLRKPLMDLDIKQGFLVACIVRENEIIIPRGSDTIEMGDTVIIVTTIPHVQSLQDMIHPR